MTDTTVATAVTNTNPGSVVQVAIDDLVCSISAVVNEFSDKLPIIPSDSRVDGEDKILYRLILKAIVVRHRDGRTVANQPLLIKSIRPHDRLVSTGRTDEKGELLITLETRELGELELRCMTTGMTLSPFKLTLKEAWYQSLFLITGYHVCAEKDFSGDLVEARGLNEKHKEDFLYSARGVPMQGTGEATDGQYIKLQRLGGGWHRNRAGNRDYVNSPENTSFIYSDGVTGAFGPVRKNHSIAVDPNVIPKRSHVEIEAVGSRYADDTGTAIIGYHIDNFLGAGNDVVHAWLHGGVNGTKRRVKYLGGKND